MNIKSENPIFRLTLGLIVTLSVFLSLAFVPSVAKAQFDPVGDACKQSPEAAICKDSKQAQPQNGEDAENPVTETIGNVANIVAIAVGVISVIIIIISGITMTLSAGDTSKVKSSRDAIIYACVGILVVVLARTIVTFIVNRL